MWICVISIVFQDQSKLWTRTSSRFCFDRHASELDHREIEDIYR